MLGVDVALINRRDPRQRQLLQAQHRYCCPQHHLVEEASLGARVHGHERQRQLHRCVAHAHRPQARNTTRTLVWRRPQYYVAIRICATALLSSMLCSSSISEHLTLSMYSLASGSTSTPRLSTSVSALWLVAVLETHAETTPRPGHKLSGEKYAGGHSPRTGGVVQRQTHAAE